MLLEIQTDNAAFDDLLTEAARILREVANRVEAGDTHGYVYDINGNRVGKFSL